MWRFMLFTLLLILTIPLHVDGDQQRVVVVDRVLTVKDIDDFLSRLGEEDILWSFHNLAASEIRNDSGANKGAFQASHYWMARLVSAEFEEGDFHSLWDKLKQQVAAHFSYKANELQVHRVGAQISSRGDNVLSLSQCATHSEGFLNIILVLFMIPKWDKNNYGEIVVYGDNGEVIKSIHPLNGRMVMVPCGFNFVIKPPSMDCKDRLRTLMIHVSSLNAPPSLLTSKEYKAYTNEKIELHSFQALMPLTHKLPELNIAKFITRQFNTSRGHPIVVFDDVIPLEIIDILADTMINGIYVDNPPEANSTDNVPWILAFGIEPVVESPLWYYVKAIAEYTSQKQGYYPYDVSCNSIRSHDATTVHTDCAEHQDEFTLLIYLNRNWTENDHGETIFFNYDRTEMIFAIRPKYGRVTIFQGTIPHSARPPSPTIHDPRFTLAIKFAASKEEALTKTLKLDTEPIIEYMMKVGPDEAEKINKVLNDILTGKKTQLETEMIVREYERKIKEL
ncbi:hypothetical protein QZH41_009536 [Actinostola sp. cb2023]|nr:hypothetical protein QZH41_009536 [Actinostola sp. cb2023]